MAALAPFFLYPFVEPIHPMRKQGHSFTFGKRGRNRTAE
jgi:hypothetical protein